MASTNALFNLKLFVNYRKNLKDFGLLKKIVYSTEVDDKLNSTFFEFSFSNFG
jgi:hypothetical protein